MPRGKNTPKKRMLAEMQEMDAQYMHFDDEDTQDITEMVDAATQTSYTWNTVIGKRLLIIF